MLRYSLESDTSHTVAMKKLTAKAVRDAAYTGKRYKLNDGAGLYLHVIATGPVWRYDYQHHGKRRTLTIGPLSAIPLSDARLAHQAAVRLLKVEGIDPADHKQSVLRADQAVNEHTLQAIAEEWLSGRTTWAQSHRVKVELRLKNDVYPVLGAEPINAITPSMVLTCLKRIEERGAIDSAHRTKQTLAQIFRFAVATDRADSDPTAPLKGALKSAQKKSYPHLTNPKRLGEVLRLIDGYGGQFTTRQALRLAPLVFVRSGELRGARWDEIDLDAGRWTIPAARMKRSSNGNHLVPLSTQAVQILRELHDYTGHGELVFRGTKSSKTPISDTALNMALRRLGIGGDELVIHGFRHTASTLLNEMRGFDPDLIEVQLHHANQSMRAKYNKAEYLDARVAMMQAWSDYLDRLRVGESKATASVIQLGVGA